MKLPVTIKGSSKVTPQMAERQREIQKEVNARYRQLVGGEVGGRTGTDTHEEDLHAHEIVERHHHRVVALSEEYNKVKQRADAKEDRARELAAALTLEASAGGLRAPMTDQELELIIAERRDLLHQFTHSPNSPSKSQGGSGGDRGGNLAGGSPPISSLVDAVVFAGHAAVYRAKVVDASSTLDERADAEAKSLREDLRTRLTERDEIFEEERRMTGTYKAMASRLADSKKEEAARNDDMGELMALRDAQIERLKMELMTQDKSTRKVADELRARQDMLMERRRAWEGRRQDLLMIVEDSLEVSGSHELRDAVSLRNQAFTNRVGKFGINLEDLKPEDKLPKITPVPVSRVNKAAAARGGGRDSEGTGGEGRGGAGAARGEEGGGSGGRKGGRDGREGAQVKPSKVSMGPTPASLASPSSIKLPEVVDRRNNDGSGCAMSTNAADAAHVFADSAAFAAAEAAAASNSFAALDGRGDSFGGMESPPVSPTKRHDRCSQYKRATKQLQSQRRVSYQQELEQKKELEQEAEAENAEEAEKERTSQNELLQQDRKSRIVAERERMRLERLGAIEAKALTNDFHKNAKAMGMSGEAGGQRSRMERLFGHIARSLGMPECTDAMEVANTVVELAENQHRKTRELDQHRKEAGEARRQSKDRVATHGEEDDDLETRERAPTGAAGLASASLTANCVEKEALLLERQKVYASHKAAVQAKIIAKAHEMSGGGGLRSIRDVVELEERIETTTNHWEWTMTRVAVSSKLGKNAAMGISDIYQHLRRHGRVWRAVEVFARIEVTPPLSRVTIAVKSVLPAQRSAARLPQAPAPAGGPPPHSQHAATAVDDDAWDFHNDPNASVHPGSPLAAGEGDALADEGGMVELNLARINDVAASLVAMTRAVKVDGVDGRRHRTARSLSKLPILGGVGGKVVEGAGAGVGALGGEVTGGDAKVSSGASARDSASLISEGDGDEGDELSGNGHREGGAAGGSGSGGVGNGSGGGSDTSRAVEDEESAASGAGGGQAEVIKARMPSMVMGRSKLSAVHELQQGVHKARHSCKAVLDHMDSESSSDDDDVQAGGRARIVLASDDDEGDDQDWDAKPSMADLRLGIKAGNLAKGRAGGRSKGRAQSNKEGARGAQGAVQERQERISRSTSFGGAQTRQEKMLPRSSSTRKGLAVVAAVADAEPKLRQRRPSFPPPSSSLSPAAMPFTASSTKNLALNTMPKIVETSPVSRKTPSRASSNKSSTSDGSNGGSNGGKKGETNGKKRGELTLGGEKGLYSGKVKKQAGTSAAFDDPTHSGSRSYSADRPLPV